MGLLDDAIREHLELKRKHGADPGEIARLEREALSPAVREAAPPQAEEELEDELYDEPAGEEQWEDEAPYAGHEREVVAEAPPAEAASHAGGPHAHEDELPAPGPAAEEHPHGLDAEADLPAQPEVDDQPTTAFDTESMFAEEDRRSAAAERDRAESPIPSAPASPAPAEQADEPDPAAEIFADEEPEEDEDVLEETPDFLQETPEHDRLWFEQKPPRDFDFGN